MKSGTAILLVAAFAGFYWYRKTQQQQPPSPTPPPVEQTIPVHYTPAQVPVTPQQGASLTNLQNIFASTPGIGGL